MGVATRQAYGPIEHQIRIENLDRQEIWIPMQDSLAFNWQIDPQTPLEHLFVEKGADTPSPVGTHQVAITEGYHWTGMSSTYGDLKRATRAKSFPGLWSKKRCGANRMVCGHRVQRPHPNLAGARKRFSPWRARTEPRSKSLPHASRAWRSL